MKRFTSFLCALFFITMVGGCSTIGDMATGVKNVVMEPKKSAEKVAAGLKEALTVSTADAVMVVSKVGGYFENKAIRIIVPGELEPAVRVLRGLGLGHAVDDFEMSMNNAAENAAPQAREIFMAAISDMTFDDAMAILKGGDTAATDYLKKKTYVQMYAVFRPVIRRSMSKIGVNQRYESMVAPLSNMSGGAIQPLELDAYVTERALDGLFKMVAKGEVSIRKNPAVRGSKLLVEVFS